MMRLFESVEVPQDPALYHSMQFPINTSCPPPGCINSLRNPPLMCKMRCQLHDDKIGGLPRLF